MYLTYGPNTESLGVVVDIVNNKQVVVDCPGLSLHRTLISTKRLQITKLLIGGVTQAMKRRDLAKLIKKFNLQKKFDCSALGSKLKRQRRRLGLTDFERFKVKILKQKLGRAIRTHVNKNKKKLIATAN